MIDRRSGIYKILNKVNGKFYIGSAVDFYNRWHSHKHYLNNRNHHNSHLQRAWDKYWNISFEFIILEICDKNKLVEREQHWIDATNCCDPEIGYNIKITANSNAGLKFSDAHKAKMSAWQIGRQLSNETKEKISNTLKGRKLPEETRIKMSISRRKQFDKFLCEAGYKCKCLKCIEDKRDYQRNYMRARRNSKIFPSPTFETNIIILKSKI